MEPRVERHTMNPKPSMFQAGLSNKFTKRHITNFHDTTLTAASAAKVRAELKMERQASAIEKQQQKIEHEMKKIEAITEKLHRQQQREAKRLRNRLTYAASRIQAAFRRHLSYEHSKREAAATEIQRHWRGHHARQIVQRILDERIALITDAAARVVTRAFRRHVCRLILRHEIAWRDYAATTIQCAARQRQAHMQLVSLRVKKAETVLRNRAAVVIQSHTRGFLTRLVYMDVLYLVCRIQSAVRGFLVRKRLRWLLSLNLQAILSLQALARGFITRRRLEKQPMRPTRAIETVEPLASTRHRRPARPRGVQSTEERATPRKRPSIPLPRDAMRAAPYAIATLATMASPVVTSPQRVKRSYWLPSGANTTAAPSRRRLPQLPAPKRKLPVAEASLDDTTAVVDAVTHRVVQLQQMARRKLGKQRPPQRLAPLERSCESHDTHQVAGNTDDEAERERRAADERRAREEVLKHKLLARKAQEKRRQELDAAQRLEQQNEAAERKQMEREEKRTRLLLKTTQRKHQEIKLRRQTMEQQREERERMDMMREERLVKLHTKKLSRLLAVAHESSVKKAARHEPVLDEDDSDPESDYEAPATDLQQREEATRKAARMQSIEQAHLQRLHKMNHIASVPIPSKRAKPRNKPTGTTVKKTQELRAVYGGGSSSLSTHGNQTSHTYDTKSRRDHDDLHQKYAGWDFHSDELEMRAELVEDEAEFNYGNDFDDVVDEANLTRLLC